MLLVYEHLLDKQLLVLALMQKNSYLLPLCFPNTRLFVRLHSSVRTDELADNSIDHRFTKAAFHYKCERVTTPVTSTVFFSFFSFFINFPLLRAVCQMDSCTNFHRCGRTHELSPLCGLQSVAHCGHHFMLGVFCFVSNTESVSTARLAAVNTSLTGYHEL